MEHVIAETVCWLKRQNGNQQTWWIERDAKTAKRPNGKARIIIIIVIVIIMIVVIVIVMFIMCVIIVISIITVIGDPY